MQSNPFILAICIGIFTCGVTAKRNLYEIDTHWICAEYEGGDSTPEDGGMYKQKLLDELTTIFNAIRPDQSLYLLERWADCNTCDGGAYTLMHNSRPGWITPSGYTPQPCPNKLYFHWTDREMRERWRCSLENDEEYDTNTCATPTLVQRAGTESK